MSVQERVTVQCFPLLQSHYHKLPYPKTKRKKFEPRIKLNHNKYTSGAWPNEKVSVISLARGDNIKNPASSKDPDWWIQRGLREKPDILSLQEGTIPKGHVKLFWIFITTRLVYKHGINRICEINVAFKPTFFQVISDYEHAIWRLPFQVDTNLIPQAKTGFSQIQEDLWQFSVKIQHNYIKSNEENSKQGGKPWGVSPSA